VLGYKRHNAMEAMDHVQITTDLDQVIRSADFLSLHVPSVPATRNMIGTRELSIMKPNSYLINTARGDVVDNDALFLALRERRLAGAAVDVFVGEVPDMDNPLLHLSNIIVTPHTAAFTKESVERMSLFAAIGVDEVLSGKQPTNPVNTVTLEESDELFTCAS